MYLFLLSGLAAITWAVTEIRKERKLAVRQQQYGASIAQLTNELQTVAETVIAEMEVEADKLRGLLAECRNWRQESSPPTPGYPEPIQLVKERKKRLTGGRKGDVVAMPGKFQRVLDLAAAGWPDGDIARETGIGQGEVKLIRQLRK